MSLVVGVGVMFLTAFSRMEGPDVPRLFDWSTSVQDGFRLNAGGLQQRL